MSQPTARSDLGLVVLVLFLSLVSPLLGACQPTSVPPVVKIGLIAPFEGPSRPLGYEVLQAVQLRLETWNEGDNFPKVELIALNDDGDAMVAASLGSQLALDQEVRLVLGPPQSHTATAVLPVLEALAVPTISLAVVPEAHFQAVAPFAGSEQGLEAVLSPHVYFTGVAREQPVHESASVIWLGDPMGLADLINNNPDSLAAAGSVAAEDIVFEWTQQEDLSLIWAAATPSDFEAFTVWFKDRYGFLPSLQAAVAYQATDEALKLLQENDQRQWLLQAVSDMTNLPMKVYQRYGDNCCIPVEP